MKNITLQNLFVGRICIWLLCVVACLLPTTVQSAPVFAITGGPNGTSTWSTKPTSNNIFTSTSSTQYELCFTLSNASAEFKILMKDNGTAGEDWGWNSEFRNFSITEGISGSPGNNLKITLNQGEDICIVITQNGSSYTVAAKKYEPTFYMEASPSATLIMGQTATLTAHGADRNCVWEYSEDDGHTWYSYTGTTGGTFNSIATVTPSVSTYYRVTSGTQTATKEITISTMAYAITGGVNGTSEWSTSPDESSMFTPAGDHYECCFTYVYGKEFKLLAKENGQVGEDWGWDSSIQVTNGSNITGGTGNLSITGFNDGDGVCLILTETNGTYTLKAEPGTRFVILPNLPNPIEQGANLTLTATETTSYCTWEYSYDGVTWQPYGGAISGTFNEVIAPTPFVPTYYKVTNAEGKVAQYKVDVKIKCEGQTQTHLDLTFGTLSSATARRQVDNVKEKINTDVYDFSPSGKEIHDGFYAILANPVHGGRGDKTTGDGCTQSSCLGDVRSSGEYWYNDIADHTSDDVNGGMLMANCKSKGEIIYEYTATGLCKNMYMTFSAWFANAAVESSTTPINTRFRILDQNKQEILTARLDVNNIKADEGWRQGSTAFFSGENETLTVQIINNGSSGYGNDILIDDIQFKSCVPLLSIKPALEVECGNKTTITVETEGIDQVFDGVPYYLWQRYNYSTGKWDTIADDPNPSNTSYYGSGWDKISYIFSTEYHPTQKPRFRVIMSSDPNVAKNVGQDIFPVCLNYAITQIIDVDCGCSPQTFALTSGSNQQAICLGTDIQAVTYQATGHKTTGIQFIDYTFNGGNRISSAMPSGMNITHNASQKSGTITGTPSVAGDYKIRFTAYGTPGEVCETDTLTLSISVKEKPTLTVNGNATQSDCENEALQEIVFTYGGTATGVSYNFTDAEALAKGYTFTTDASQKTITVNGTFLQTLNYTISTTGQDAVCVPATQSGTFTAVPNPVAPNITFPE